PPELRLQLRRQVRDAHQRPLRLVRRFLVPQLRRPVVQRAEAVPGIGAVVLPVVHRLAVHADDIRQLLLRDVPPLACPRDLGPEAGLYGHAAHCEQEAKGRQGKVTEVAPGLSSLELPRVPLHSAPLCPTVSYNKATMRKRGTL